MQLAPKEVKANYSNEQFENFFYDIGYEEVNMAVDKAEMFYKKEIVLPVQLPPISFTHIFGRFNDIQGEINDGLEFEYINKDIPQNHYMIWVKPTKFKLILNKNQIDRTIHLKDGSEAIIGKFAKSFHVLIFENNGWQYILSIDRHSPENVSPSTLINIANSL